MATTDLTKNFSSSTNCRELSKMEFSVSLIKDIAVTWSLLQYYISLLFKTLLPNLFTNTLLKLFHENIYIRGHPFSNFLFSPKKI